MAELIDVNTELYDSPAWRVFLCKGQTPDFSKQNFPFYKVGLTIPIKEITPSRFQGATGDYQVTLGEIFLQVAQSVYDSQVMQSIRQQAKPEDTSWDRQPTEVDTVTYEGYRHYLLINAPVPDSKESAILFADTLEGQLEQNFSQEFI